MAGATDTQRTIEAIWRIESAQLIASLGRMVRDVGLAEDLAHDALVTALERWPESGVPEKPGAWLMATAKNRAIDHLRRRALLDQKHEQIGRDLQSQVEEDLDAALDDDIGDDLLGLIFTTCHPVLSTDARVALTLRLLGGLRTDEIARAFLVGEATVAQRIVRAKRTLAETGVTFEVPSADQLESRLDSVLEVIYLVFNEGYSATAGDDWMRPALCAEALRLGRILAGLMPREPEVHGLVALMEIQASRARARVDASGTPILLLDQDRGRWDHMLIGRGSQRSGVPRSSAAVAAPMPCRQRSPPVTRARARPRRPTGRASSRSTTRCPRSPRQRSWSSTAPWRCQWRTGPGQVLSSSINSSTSPRCSATTCFRVSAAICWPSWDAPKRHAPSSSARPR